MSDDGQIGVKRGDTVALVRALVVGLTGTAPTGIRRMTNGHCNTVFEVDLPAGALVVRTNRSPDVLQGTEQNIAILGRLGLPVPRFLASDLSLSRYPFAYIVFDRLPGHDLREALDSMTAEQMTTLAQHVVSLEKLAGTLPVGSSYGWMSIGAADGASSWTEVIENKLSRHLHDLAGLVEARLGSQFRARFDDTRSYFDSVAAIPFLDDLTTKNVLVKEGQLSGVVDFDCICYGDPLLWLALTRTSVAAGHGPAALHYTRELERLWPVLPESRPVVAFYSALFALDFACEQLSTGDANEVQRLLGLADQFLVESVGS